MKAVSASTSSAVEGECFGTNLLNLVTVGHLMVTKVQNQEISTDIPAYSDIGYSDTPLTVTL